MENKDSLRKIRTMLKSRLAEKHIDTDTSLKKSLKEAIKDLDHEIEKNEGPIDLYRVLKLLGKILDKLPWIVSLLEKLR